MRHFWVKLYTEEIFLSIEHACNRAARRGCHQLKAFRHGCHFIAVAHPHIKKTFTVFADMVFDVFEQCVVRLNLNLGIAKFTDVGALHTATQLLCHCLHAVADTKHWQTKLEHHLRCARRTRLCHRLRATCQNNTGRVVLADFRFVHVPGADFREHTDFTHTTCDQLSVL